MYFTNRSHGQTVSGKRLHLNSIGQLQTRNSLPYLSDEMIALK